MEEGVRAKKGYSIWSLLVITGLIAVWTVVPSWINLEAVRDNLNDLFFIGHQLVLWIACSVLIWIACQKRKVVAFICFLIIATAWGPAVVALGEEMSNVGYVAPNRTYEALAKVGLANHYQSFYSAMSRIFGYE